MFPSGLVWKQKKKGLWKEMTVIRIKSDKKGSLGERKKSNGDGRKNVVKNIQFNGQRKWKDKEGVSFKKKGGKRPRNLLVSLSFNNLLVKTTSLAILQLLLFPLL